MDGAGVLSRGPDRASVLAFHLPLVLFLAIYAAVHAAMPRAFVSDDTDQVLFSQGFALGYHEQPPLYSWMACAAFGALGVNGAALGVLKASALGGLMLALFGCGRSVLGDDRRAALAAFAPILIPSFAWNAIAYLTHTILACLFAAASLDRLERLRRSGKALDYAWLGLALGLGVLSKYNFAVFAAALLAAALTVGPFRARLLDRRSFLTLAVALAVVLPHATWAAEHWGRIVELGAIKAKLPSGGHSWSSALGGTTRLAVNLLLSVGPMLVVFLAIWPRELLRGEASSDPIRAELGLLLGRFFLAGLCIALALIAATGAGHVHERWLQPFAVLLPLSILLRVGDSTRAASRRSWLGGFLAACGVGLTATWAGQVAFGVRAFGGYDDRMVYREVAEAVVAEAGRDATIWAEDRMVPANLRAWMPGARFGCTAHPLYEPPGTSRGRTVVIWNTAHGKRPPPVARAFVRGTLNAAIPHPSEFHHAVVREGPGGSKGARLAFFVVPAPGESAGRVARTVGAPSVVR